MAYVISASTLKSSVAVTRDDPGDALRKLAEFEDLGLAEVAVRTTGDGYALTRDQLQALVARGGGVAVSARR